MDELEDIVYYLYMDEKYIDFPTIMYLLDKDKTFTWRMLIRKDIPYIEYMNRKLYKFDNLMECVEFIELLDVDKLNLQ